MSYKVARIKATKVIVKIACTPILLSEGSEVAKGKKIVIDMEQNQGEYR